MGVIPVVIVPAQAGKEEAVSPAGQTRRTAAVTSRAKRMRFVRLPP